ncbi:MAG TPA: hypothetical protein VGR28_09425, partial [Candidatus Thermoplasmatota archaeon]|nr:hypothetical protein [Candidatus Thermoplasmatota archaeon]
MRFLLALTFAALLGTSLAAPTLSLPATCPVGEARTLPLPQGPTLVCVFDVHVLADDARIVQQTAQGPVELSRAGIRTLGGVVPGDPVGFVRLVEAPGYRAGMVRTLAGFTWFEHDGSQRSQGQAPHHTAWALDASSFGAPGAPTAVRLLVRADPGFLQDRGASWHLYALAIATVTDGAYRAQAGMGFEVAGLTGGNPSIGPLHREV